MRALVACLLLVGCSSSTEVAPRDASVPPEAAPEDASVDAPDAEPKGPQCPGSAPAQSCFILPASCASGFRYGCTGGCPTGDTGACEVVALDLYDHVSELCCERAACVRDVSLDLRCRDEHDSGAYDGWSCPAGAKRPGTCTPLGGIGTDLCCRP